MVDCITTAVESVTKMYWMIAARFIAMESLALDLAMKIAVVCRGHSPRTVLPHAQIRTQ